MLAKDTIIRLCDLKFLDNSYTHTCDFDSLNSQIQWFNSKTGRVVSGCSHIRQDSTIRVPIYIDDVINYNYLTFNNKNKNWFMFINDVKYINDNLTELIVEVDVFQTYLFNHNLKTSYIDRCHVPRWRNYDGVRVPTNETVDESVRYGNIIQRGRRATMGYADSFVIVSSDPLGKVDFNQQTEGGDNGGGGGSTGGGGSYKEGKPSKDLFRFIKGYEAYAPNQYYDSGGVLTIGYGVTNGEPSHFADLIKNQPVSEEKASTTMWDIMIQEYGLPMKCLSDEGYVINQNQYDACISLAYNGGKGIFITGNQTVNKTKKYPKLLKGLNNGTITNQAFRDGWTSSYITDGSGNVLQGLIDRRNQEVDWILLNKVPPFRDIPVLNSKGSIVGTLKENNGNGWLP